MSNAGGLGKIALPGLPAPALETVLGRLAQGCHGPFGVSFLVPFLGDEALEVAAEHGPVVEFFYGDPDPVLVGRARPATVLWQVGSAEEARAAVDAGADAVIAQGTEAGGHVRGKLSLLPLLNRRSMPSMCRWSPPVACPRLER